MLRELHAWKNRYPKVAEAILPFWYHCFSAELWSNCRSQFGAKFLVRASSAKQFESFADNWQGFGDLFIYAASFALRPQNGIDVIPFDEDLFEEMNIQMVVFKGKPPPPEEAFKKFKAVLLDIPYFVPDYPLSWKEYPEAERFIVGRQYRVPEEVHQLMLGNNAEALISRRLMAMPVRGREDDTALIHDMCIAWHNGLLPVFFGALPEAGEVSLERDVELSLQNERDVAVKGCLRKFMADLRANPDAALARLVEELEGQATGPSVSSITTPVRIAMLKFKAGPNDVVHPALVFAKK